MSEHTVAQKPVTGYDYFDDDYEDWVDDLASAAKAKSTLKLDSAQELLLGVCIERLDALIDKLKFQRGFSSLSDGEKSIMRTLLYEVSSSAYDLIGKLLEKPATDTPASA